MKERNRYLEFVIEELAPLGEITSRAMFGGHCLYCNGIVFALMARDALYLKTDDINRPAFEARRLRPFNPFDNPGHVMSYHQAPPEIFEEPAARKGGLGRAVKAGRPGKKKKKKGRPGPIQR